MGLGSGATFRCVRKISRWIKILLVLYGLKFSSWRMFPVWGDPFGGASEMKLGSGATLQFIRKSSRWTAAYLSRRGLKCGSTRVKQAEVVTAFQL